jgi:hypothetical protein
MFATTGEQHIAAAKNATAFGGFSPSSGVMRAGICLLDNGGVPSAAFSAIPRISGIVNGDIAE